MNELTAKDLRGYFEGKKKSPVYDETVQMYKDMYVHMEGALPGDLLQKRRPNEGDELLQYRLTIYQPITNVTTSRVLKSLGKIRRSRDYSINYPSDKFPSIATTETLREYCENNFPYTSSVTNWMFSVCMKAILTDANCAILVTPINPNPKANEYKKPYPVIYFSDQIIDYLHDRYAILKCADQVDVPDGKSGTRKSDKYLHVTTSQVLPYVKSGDNWILVTDEIINHNLGYLPIIRPRCEYAKSVGEYNIYKSFIAGMLPGLNEAVREYSDLQAAVVSFLFPERVEIATQECNVCNGSGMIPNPLMATDKTAKQLVCTACNGLGAVSGASPLKKHVIRLPKTNLGEQPVPMPPISYVEKNIEIVKVQQQRVDDHQYRSLSAINMQFLAQTPLSISGDAKQVDRDELNNFVYGVAEGLIYIQDLLLAMICDYRYSVLYPDATTRRKMLPHIPVPEHFDIIGTGDKLEMLTKMRTGNVSGSLIAAIETEIIKEQFYLQPDVEQPLVLEKTLDPLKSVSVPGEKDIMLMNGVITKRDYVISSYISAFVQRAFAEYQDFYNMPLDKQQSIISGYADEKMKEIGKSKMPPDPEPDPADPNEINEPNEPNAGGQVS